MNADKRELNLIQSAFIRVHPRLTLLVERHVEPVFPELSR